ncbi:zinc finger MYM-type protein 1-like [Sipha flava]|uniref:Zinc finger MYM-type protein 1-like n=1 Tax=Sipha flava TaxID=143950 RepID=A0A8B8FAY5_9HEMI|nr:zinc finger MYM-type protein 1-like [Sipha flava]XP_025407501.1 zinc finger MYM-type protein 1-like [Sipha flava]
MPCRLFRGESSLAKEDGCNDWKNINRILSSHKNSKDHHICQKNMLNRSRANEKVDNMLCSQIDAEIHHWKNVLKRVLAVIKKLSSRGLAFRGHDERFGSFHNGNYMMCLELLAEFDPFLANHIAIRGNPGKGNTSYLSSTICNEFINLMGKHVTNKIVNEIKQCKYFSIVVDSTSDICHVDQLSFVLRYVKDSTPVERFLRFLPKVGHKSEKMEDAVLPFLKNLGIDINNCRGQSYDNASNMSGAYTGLQARIVKHNSLAIYVPCSAHSLNLVGSCAAECVPEASAFFNTIQTIFTFFAASTNRWDIFTSNLKNGQTVLKRANGTRWSCKHDACKSVATCWAEVIQSLSNIRDDMMEKAATRSEAKGYIDQINNFEFVFMIIFWNTLLERFNATSKSLQSTIRNLDTVVHLYRSLTDFVTQLRNEVMFEKFIIKAKQSITEEYKFDMKRVKTKSLLLGETRKNETKPQNGKDNLRINVYYPILDCIHIELHKRQLAYTEVAERFDFLLHLKNFEADIILKKAEHLQMLYKNDLDDNFPTEVLHYKEYEIFNFE